MLYEGRRRSAWVVGPSGLRRSSQRNSEAPERESVSMLVGVVLFLFLAGVRLWRRLNGRAKPARPLPAWAS